MKEDNLLTNIFDEENNYLNHLMIICIFICINLIIKYDKKQFCLG